MAKNAFKMNHRLQQIIQYKTGGKQNVFAELMGWKTPYLNKLVKGVNFGLQPVLAILSRFPEIDARWLLFGEGSMLTVSKQSELRFDVSAHIQEVLRLEQYLPYMQPDELHEFEQVVINGKTPVFSPETISKWEIQAEEDRNKINKKFSAAAAQSDELCKQKTVRK